VLESMPELNDYYRNQCACVFDRLPIDWQRIFEAGGGEVLNDDQAHWGANDRVQFVWDGPKYDVDGWSWRVPHRVKDNLKVDDHIMLPHAVKVDFDTSRNLVNYDAPPQGVLDMPQYGWDYTRDMRFNLAGVLVQAQNPEIVLVNTAEEHMRLQILRSTGRVRRLAGLE